jgi:hypothetical protein
MNSNTVLKKIMTLLSSESKEEVLFVTAELVDGTVVESATFDVGETVEVVSADGEKSPAPDGEHELFLKDGEGNEVRIRIITEGGVITERMNVEEAAEEPEAEEEMSSEETSETVEMEEEVVEEEVVSMEIISKTVEEMAYRIEELEKKIAEMQVEEEVEDEVEAEEEEELPKLDGAPVQASKVNVSRKSAGKKMDRQSAFLSKLYN